MFGGVVVLCVESLGFEFWGFFFFIVFGRNFCSLGKLFLVFLVGGVIIRVFWGVRIFWLSNLGCFYCV